MGDDDIMEPEYLQEFENLIRLYPFLDIYHCRSKIINMHSEVTSFTPSWPEFETVYETMWHRIQNMRIQFISDFMFRTETLMKQGGFYKMPLAWGSDDISVYRAIGTKGIAHTNNPVFNYRIHSRTISVSGSIDLKLEAINREKEWLIDYLIDIPNKSTDKIIHRNLKTGILKYIQRKKIRIISQSYNGRLVKQFIYWNFKKRTIDMKGIELLYSVLEFLKHKKSEAISVALRLS